MSLTITAGATATSTSSGTTLALTGVTAAIGDMLVLGIAADNGGTAGASSFSSVADSAGNTWTTRSTTNRSPGGVTNDGTTLVQLTCLLTAALVAGTVTITFADSITAKAAALWRVQPGSGETIEFVEAGPGATGNGTAPSADLTVAESDTVFGWVAAEQGVAATADSDVTRGAWSTRQNALANTGSANTSQALTGQWKTTTSTGNQSFDPTFGGARDYAINSLVIRGVISLSFALTEAADVAAFTAFRVTLAAVEASDIAAFAAGVSYPAMLAASERPDRVALQLTPGWPAALPKPTVEGYGLRPAEAVLRAALESGAARVYRRTRRPLAEVSVVWQLDSFQQVLFDGFYRHQVCEGGEWFAVDLAFPSGLALVSARFKDKLTQKAIGGGRWQIGATLEVLVRPVMTDAALTALLDDAGDDPAWPDALPKPLLDSWEMQPQPEVIRSEDGAGLPRQRRRSLKSVTEVPTSWELTAEQAALFDGFFVHRGKDGAQWFDFPVFQGLGVIETKARFLGQADWTPRAGGKWKVAAPIEIREREILTAAEYAMLFDEDFEALLAAIAAMHHVIGEELWSEE